MNSLDEAAEGQFGSVADDEPGTGCSDDRPASVVSVQHEPCDPAPAVPPMAVEEVSAEEEPNKAGNAAEPSPRDAEASRCPTLTLTRMLFLWSVADLGCVWPCTRTRWRAWRCLRPSGTAPSSRRRSSNSKRRLRPAAARSCPALVILPCLKHPLKQTRTRRRPGGLETPPWNRALRTTRSSARKWCVPLVCLNGALYRALPLCFRLCS